MPISKQGIKFWAPCTDGFLTSGRPSDISGNGNNSSSVGGTPTFSSAGMELDGVNENALFPAAGIYNDDEQTIALRFTPDFAHDDGASHYFCDSAAPRYAIQKTGANALRIILGGTLIADIGAGTIGPLWTPDAEHTLIVLAEDTANRTNAWLNGTQVVTNDASAWAKGDTATLFIGSSLTPGDYWNGEEKDLMVFSRLWSVAERTAFDAGQNPSRLVARGRTKGIVRSR